ncbi:hypothetical protein [Escherichia coli]|uniref:hypothetical protein n=1 Tax=Escherichia coli TaxID=562 RepID=UPI000BE30E84|nr:hypothetical protein [Escherichia coli]
MAHKTKFHNSDTALAIRHGRRSHAFKYDWYQHDPCTEEQAEWLIQNYRRRGYEFKKALSLDFRHWIISVRLPYCHERCNSDPHPTPEIRSRG